MRSSSSPSDRHVQNTTASLLGTGGIREFHRSYPSPVRQQYAEFTLTAAPQALVLLVSAASNLLDVAGGLVPRAALIEQYTCVAVWPIYQLKAVSGGTNPSGNMTNGVWRRRPLRHRGAISSRTPAWLCKPDLNIVSTHFGANNYRAGESDVTAGQTATFTAAARAPNSHGAWQVSTDAVHISAPSRSHLATLSSRQLCRKQQPVRAVLRTRPVGHHHRATLT